MLKTTLDSEDATLIALERSIEDAQGARGTGKVITFSGLSPEEVSNTLLEEMGGGGSAKSSIIESAKLAYELDREVITGAYLIPPSLAGIDQKSGFSGADLQEAYYVFNAVTQGGRDAIEAELNSILEYSIFKTRDVSIKKLTLDVQEEKLEGEDNEEMLINKQ